jgi:hypothetical protein
MEEKSPCRSSFGRYRYHGRIGVAWRRHLRTDEVNTGTKRWHYGSVMELPFAVAMLCQTLSNILGSWKQRPIPALLRDGAARGERRSYQCPEPMTSGHGERAQLPRIVFGEVVRCLSLVYCTSDHFVFIGETCPSQRVT